MEVYGSQIEPLMTLILTTPVEGWDGVEGPYEMRAAVRGELSTWRTAMAD